MQATGVSRAGSRTSSYMDASPPPSGTSPGLLRAIGVRGLTASIINITIGGGIFALPAAIAAGMGAASPLAFVVCALAMTLIVLCFAEAGSRVSLTGGPYAYVEVALGPFVGFLCGVLLWLTGIFATAAVATVFSGTLARLVPALQGRVAEAIVLAVLFVAMAWVNVRGVKQGTRLVEITTVSKLVPLLLFVAVGAFFVRGSNLAIESLPSASAFGVTTVTLIFAFAGVESALVPSGEVKEPHRTVPRALFFAILLITLLYIGIQVVAQGILGPALADPANARAPLAAAAERFMGSGGAIFMLAGAAISTFGYVSGMTLAAPRALYAFGRDGFAPTALAKVHDRFRTPHVAIIVQTAIVFALAASGTFIKLVKLANVSVLLLYLACCIAAWELRRRDVRSGGVPFRVPAGGLVPWIASAVILAILASATADELLVVGAALAVAAAIFIATGARRRALRPAES